MTTNKTAVFGIFGTREQAERCLEDLHSSGFSYDDVSVLAPDHARGTKDFAHEKNTKGPEGATAGGATGGVVGGALGLMAALGTLAIPGVGPLLAAGPIVAALAGFGAGGAVGGLIGGLVGLGMPEYEARRFEGRIQKGGVLLSVHCDTTERVDRAKHLLKQTGAQDIATEGEASADQPSPQTMTARY